MIMSGRKGWPETGARHGSGEMIDSLPNDSRFNVWRRPEMLPVGPRYTVGRGLCSAGGGCGAADCVGSADGGCHILMYELRDLLKEDEI